MAAKVSLTVNNKPIPIEDFVQQFIGNVITGMVTELKGPGEVKNIHLSIERDIVDIKLGDASLSINPFVSRLIKNTVLGMVATLKGVDGVVKSLEAVVSA